MPHVTKISIQQKRDDRYSVYIDGRYAFSLSDLDLAASGLKVNQEITGLRIQELQDQSQIGKALDRAYNYLSFRPRSSKEMRDYLKKKDYDDPLIEKVMDRLHQNKLLNDSDFAAAWVRERQLTQPRSKQHLRQELRQKGIDSQIIDDVLNEISNDMQQVAIRDLIQKKRLLNRYDDKQKLMAYLAGKGFKYGEIKQALEELEGLG
jgi:regulatory protein